MVRGLLFECRQEVSNNMENLKVTVITPTYNREDHLEKLYRSLLAQTSDSFCWLIVDDGSTDDTEQRIMRLKNEGLVDIRYMYQANAGKHVALNSGIANVETNIIFVVDSDDLLTEDAIETILNYWPQVLEKRLAGVSFLREGKDGKIIGDKYPADLMTDTFINVRYNMNVKGDKAEVWDSKILKNYPFPVFTGEKFLGEACVWGRIANRYEMLFVNKVIYITEYLEGGLTKSGRLLRIRCPLGGMEHAKVALSHEVNIKKRIKNAWLFICYGLFAKKSIIEIIRESGNSKFVILNTPFGVALYLFWRFKYT